MSLKFIGKKKGMTHFFDKKGSLVPCTIIVFGDNVVVQKKEKKVDGYDAVQLGSFEKREKLVKKPQKGHFKKANAKPYRVLCESKVDDIDKYEVGKSLEISNFTEGQFVDVTAISKGKGYQGVMKLYGFAGGPAAHGSGFHRHAGSTGMRSTPGICFKGGKRASRMGGDKVTVENLEILAIDSKKNLLVVKGSVPGSKEGIVFIRKAIKKSNQVKKVS